MIAASAFYITKLKTKKTLESNNNNTHGRNHGEQQLHPFSALGSGIFFFFSSVSCAYANLGNKTKQNKTKQSNKA